MKFHKYPKITNSYDQKFMFFVSDMIKSGELKDEWLVQEKIHGANFSYWHDGNRITHAKRSGFIGTDESFFNYMAATTRQHENVRRVFAISLAKESVVVCGELFGGTYPGFTQGNHKAVQRGISYHPYQQFLAFDLYADGLLVSPLKAYEIFRAAKMPYIEPFLVGTLKECLEFSPTFQSTIPAYYDLPVLEGDNICEGVVIKPVEPTFLVSGERVIFKSKNESFSEIQKIKHRPAAIPIEVPDDLLALINENRLRNVLSKIGPVQPSDFSVVLKDFVGDVFEEYVSLGDKGVRGELMSNKQVRKVISRYAANLVSSNLKEIVSGTF